MLLSYLRDLKSFNRSWHLAAVLFMGGSVGSQFLGIETTPFFVWGMFSMPEKPAKDYWVHRFYADGKPLDYTSFQAPLFQRYFMTNPLDYADRSVRDCGGEDANRHFLREKLGRYYGTFEPIIVRVTNDSIDYQAFMNWETRYVAAAYSLGNVRLTHHGQSFIFKKNGPEPGPASPTPPSQ